MVLPCLYAKSAILLLSGTDMTHGDTRSHSLCAFPFCSGLSRDERTAAAVAACRCTRAMRCPEHALAVSDGMQSCIPCLSAPRRHHPARRQQRRRGSESSCDPLIPRRPQTQREFLRPVPLEQHRQRASRSLCRRRTPAHVVPERYAMPRMATTPCRECRCGCLRKKEEREKERVRANAIEAKRRGGLSAPCANPTHGMQAWSMAWWGKRVGDAGRGGGLMGADDGDDGDEDDDDDDDGAGRRTRKLWR